MLNGALSSVSPKEKKFDSSVTFIRKLGHGLKTRLNKLKNTLWVLTDTYEPHGALHKAL